MSPILGAYWVPGIPRPQGSMKTIPHRQSGRMVTMPDNPELKRWRETVRGMLLAKRGGRRFEGDRRSPVALALEFVLPRPKAAKNRAVMTYKPDLDKLIRAILDAGSDGILWVDDDQVTAIVASKRYEDPGQPTGVWILPIYGGAVVCQIGPLSGVRRAG